MVNVLLCSARSCKAEVEVFATKANQVGYRRSKNEIYFSKKAPSARKTLTRQRFLQPHLKRI